MKRILLCIILFLNVIEIYPQKIYSNDSVMISSEQQINSMTALGNDLDVLSKINPVSPTVFHFLKYGEIPIDEYTGILDISIPIYTIKTNDLELPISLQYHSGGIRVSEEASSFGLGWNLSNCGSITQITQDKDDLCSSITMNLPDYYYTPDPNPRLWNDTYLGGTNAFNFQYPFYSYWMFRSYQMPKNGSMQYFNVLFDGDTEDAEPDIFKANFNGHSLTFIIHPTTKNPIILNKKGYKLIKEVINNKVVWTIIAPDGIKYKFANIITVEQTPTGGQSPQNGAYDVHFSSNAINLNNCTPSSSGIIDPGNYNPYNNSRIWQISEIVTPNGNSVNFFYESAVRTKFDYSVQYTWYIYNYSSGSIAGVGQEIGPIKSGTPSLEWPEMNSDHITSIYAYTKTSFSMIDSITFTNGKILFQHSARTDYLGDRKVDKISALYKNNIINEYNLKYSYFSSSYSGNGLCSSPKALSELTQRLRLDSLIESGKPAYKFQYYADYNLPPKNSYATDYWGFFNGKSNNTSPLTNINSITTGNQVFQDRLVKNNNEKFSVLTYARTATLRKIIYPTGGYSEFVYELNTFNNLSEYPITEGIGLRIKSWKNYLSDGSQQQHKEFIYEGGKLSIPTKFHKSYTESYYRLEPNGYKSRSFQVLMTSACNFFTPDALGNGTYVGYDNVKTLNKDINNNYYGYIKKIYSNSPDIFPTGSLEYKLSLPTRREGIRNGLLVQEEIWDYNNVPVRIKKNYYKSVLNSSYYYGLKHQLIGLYGIVYMPVTELINTERRDLVGFYPIYGLESLLDSSIVTDHFTNGSIKQKETFEYNTDQMVKRHYSTSSRNELIDSYYDYPNDVYEVENFTSNEKQIISLLNSSNTNQISKIIRKRTFLNGNITDYYYTPYKQYNGLILPERIIKKFSDNSTNIDYEFINYDNKGNPTKIKSSDGMFTYFLWGYNSQYPVAKIVTLLDFTFSVVVNDNLLKKSNLLANIQLDVNYLKGLLTSYLNNANYQVTIYTYNPLVGMTSQTDPTGISTFYQYDTFERLENVLDNDGKLLKKNVYHYSGM